MDLSDLHYTLAIKPINSIKISKFLFLDILWIEKKKKPNNRDACNIAYKPEAWSIWISIPLMINYKGFNNRKNENIMHNIIKILLNKFFNKSIPIIIIARIITGL